MENHSPLLDALVKEYEGQGLHLPALHLKFAHLSPESFSSYYERQEITISANGSQGLAYGISQMHVAMRSKHLAELAGHFQPKFPLRPLWLGVQCKIVFSSTLAVFLPKCLLAENAFSAAFWLSKRMLEGGYNALLFGAFDISCGGQNSIETITANEHVLKHVQAVFVYLKSLHVELIFKPDFSFFYSSESSKSPFDSKYRQLVQEAMQELFKVIPATYIFWESLLFSSSYRDHSAQQATLLEVIVEEVHLLESCLLNEQNLIFFIPVSSQKTALQHAQWFPFLIDEMGPSTIFSFPAVAADMCDDQACDHPFWNVLRQSPDRSATALMPIINFGLLKQGEGLWPASNFDLIERFMPRLHGHNFKGVISIWNYLPRQGSLHDCNFFVAGMSLWRTLPASLIAETWFAAFRPKENALRALNLMKVVRSLSLELNYLRRLAAELGRALWNSESAKLQAEVLLAQLKVLKIKAEELACQQALLLEPFVTEACLLFIADAARFLHHLMPMFSIAMFRELNFEDDGFWSRVAKDKGALSAINFLVEPFCGPIGSSMYAIYADNRVDLIQA